MKWYVLGKKRNHGPFEREQILKLLAEGKIGTAQHLRSTGKEGTQLLVTAGALRDSPEGGSPKRVIKASDPIWFIAKEDGSEPDKGPFTFRELNELFSEGALNADLPVMRRRSNGDWMLMRLGTLMKKQGGGSPSTSAPQSHLADAEEPRAQRSSSRREERAETPSWYVVSRVEKGREFGPYTLAQLKNMARAGRITADQTVLRQKGRDDWETTTVGALIPDLQASTGTPPGSDFHGADATVIDRGLIVRTVQLAQSIQSVAVASHGRLSEKFPALRFTRRTRRRLIQGGGFAAAFLLGVGLTALLVRGADEKPQEAPTTEKPEEGKIALKAQAKTPKPENPTSSELSLVGCSTRMARSGLELNQAGDTPVTLLNLSVGALPDHCSPCRIRSEMSDGTRIVLVTPNVAPWRRIAEASAHVVSACGRITERAIGTTWFEVFKLTPVATRD